jgi:hypothetical protein
VVDDDKLRSDPLWGEGGGQLALIAAAALAGKV